MTDLEGWGFTTADMDDLSDVLASAYTAHMVIGTARFSRAVLGAGYRRSAPASPQWELRDMFTDRPAAPWSWTPPAEPGPEVRRVRPVERYAGDNGIWYDREPDGSGWRGFLNGRPGGVIGWLQVIAGCGSVYGGRQLVDATSEIGEPDGSSPEAASTGDRPPPTEPCSCMHYLGQQVVRCGGPHTVGEGETLRWADTAPHAGGRQVLPLTTAELDERVTHCSWCPSPANPSLRHHPGGQREHLEPGQDVAAVASPPHDHGEKDAWAAEFGHGDECAHCCGPHCPAFRQGRAQP